MKNSYLYRICRAVMFVMCLSIVIYMARKEIARFWENKDTSSVSIKRFNEQNDENGKFPTFSICFQYGNVIFSSNQFQNNVPNTNMDNVKKKMAKYRNILEGFKQYDHDLMKKFPSFSSLTIKLKDLISEYEITDEYYDVTTRWSKSMNDDRKFPFVLSYQTARLICFTLEDETSIKMNKMGDSINFQRSTLKDLEWRNSNNKNPGWIYLYMHAKGQLIRNLDKPIFSLNVVSLNVDKNDFNGIHTVSLVRVDVLKRRQDVKTPCRSYPINEDTEYLRTVVEKVQCVPIYWKALNISGSDVRLCNSTEDYKTLHGVYNGYNRTPRFWVELKWEPCYEMVVSSVVNMKEAEYFRINMKYQDLGSRYFETVNTRDFGFENLWSSFGGIVGIFLGYSVMNLFEMISNGLTWMCDKHGKKNDS